MTRYGWSCHSTKRWNASWCSFQNISAKILTCFSQCSHSKWILLAVNINKQKTLGKVSSKYLVQSSVLLLWRIIFHLQFCNTYTSGQYLLTKLSWFYLTNNYKNHCFSLHCRSNTYYILQNYNYSKIFSLMICMFYLEKNHFLINT